MNGHVAMLSVVLSAEQLEVDLAAGRVACPDCGEPLARWGFAGARVVRLRTEVRSLRPRRAYCRPESRRTVVKVKESDNGNLGTPSS